MNQQPQQIRGFTDTLSECYLALSAMNEIPDMADYAQAWADLADLADSGGRPFLADACRARAKHYAELAGGSYSRLVEGPFSEMIPVQ